MIRNKMITGDQMDKKLIAKHFVKAFLIVLITMAPAIKGNKVFAQEANVQPSIVLADWVPMRASNKVNPPSLTQIYEAYLDCLHEGAPGSSAFWACFLPKIGQSTWDANYPYIICVIQWYSGHHDHCGNCFHPSGLGSGITPCDPACHVQNACVDCCVLAGDKVLYEGHPTNYEVTVDQCVTDHGCAAQT